MKTVIAALLISFFCALSARGGGFSVRGGGDSAAIEFKNIGMSIITKLKDHQKLSFPLSVTDMERILQNVKIQSVQGPLLLDHSRKDAINFPVENRVQVDLQRWSQMSSPLKVQLVAHEILGLLKVNDANYLKSREIFQVVSEATTARNSGTSENGSDLCSKVTQRQSTFIACPTGQMISKVVFASYGMPSGTCGAYKATSCNAGESLSKVEKACLYKKECIVDAVNSVFITDPCPGQFKSLAIDVQCSDHWPDMVVTAIKISSNLFSGQAITFTAVVKNQGTAPTPPGVITGVDFYVDKIEISWSDNYKKSIAPGESVELAVNGGPVSAEYIATTGEHEVMAWVNDVNRYGEANYTNNQLTKTFKVVDTNKESSRTADIEAKSN